MGLRGVVGATAGVRRWVIQNVPYWCTEEEVRATLGSVGWREVTKLAAPSRPNQGWLFTGAPPSGSHEDTWAVDIGADRLAKIREWQTRRQGGAERAITSSRAWWSGKFSRNGDGDGSHADGEG